MGFKADRSASKRTLVPEGTFLCTFTKAATHIAQESGNLSMNYELEIVTNADGSETEAMGRKIWGYATIAAPPDGKLNDGATKDFFDICNVLNLDPEDITIEGFDETEDDFPVAGLDLPEFLDKDICVQIKHRKRKPKPGEEEPEGEQEMEARVSKFLPTS